MEGGTPDRDAIEIDFEYTVHIDGPITAELHEDTGLLMRQTSYLAAFIGIDGDIPDDRAEWHRNYTPTESYFCAHILRLVNGWSIHETAKRISADRDLPGTLGFFDEPPGPENPSPNLDPPSYTQLRDIWEETFTDRHRAACEVIAQRFIEYCREVGIPSPDPVFQVDEEGGVDAEPDEDDPTVRELTTSKATEIWKHAKPLALQYFSLKRHHNWQHEEHKFFDAQAHMASGEDLFPESGVGNLAVKGSYDDVHYPSTHRRELKRFDMEEIRAMYHKITRELVERARRNGELIGKLGLAIDRTFGHPWTGMIERDDSGESLERWILGYKNDNDERTQHYFQWATIQVVGFDIPLVLDAVPIHRGKSREEIVDELLDNALAIIDDVEMLYMDAEFDTAGVKDVCEEQGVYYLNSASWDRGETAPKSLRTGDSTVKVKTQGGIDADTPPRNTLYLPSTRASDNEEADDGGDANEESGGDASEIRQEGLDAFGLNEGDLDEEGGSPLGSFLEDIHEEDDTPSKTVEDGDGRDRFVKFETNHPKIGTADSDDGVSTNTDLIHLVTRHVRRYRARWGIENGYKKIKRFLGRSGSPDPVLRYWNFVFGCTIYNCWRLVDLLVKLEVEDNPAYTPLVTAPRFRTIAEEHFGISGVAHGSDGKPPPQLVA